MTVPIPRDQRLLDQASGALDTAIAWGGLEPSPSVRLRLLEGAASWVGGYELADFDRSVGQFTAAEGLPADVTKALAQRIAEALLDGPLPASLALSVLGDFDSAPMLRRREGKYFTDARLALEVVSDLNERVLSAGAVLDPACGAGVFLVAAGLQANEGSDYRSHLVRNVLWGVDRDSYALGAAFAAVCSLTSDIGAMAKASERFRVADSLAAGQSWWRMLRPLGFDLVLGNPPWEKLKVSRHEFALSQGVGHWYGEGFEDLGVDGTAFDFERLDIARYKEMISGEFHHQGSGEADLYKLFVELGANLTSHRGTLAFLVPAGLIRNYGARDLRAWLFREFDIDLEVMDNRERYFAIDSRFKFVRLVARRCGGSGRRVRFSSRLSGTASRQKVVQMDAEKIEQFHFGFAVPEVGEQVEWELLNRLAGCHPRFGSVDSGWEPSFQREVDMTNDRQIFREPNGIGGALSLIEGRMVHHHRVSAKRYIGGRGRRASWEVQLPFGAPLRPQWSVMPGDLRTGVEERVGRLRAGFCDITGQTNERTVLAAPIPSGVVCGNKVPTVDFSSSEQVYSWVGIANSFVFDWLARRCVTTTLNFFVLRGLPIPAWDPSSGLLAEIAERSRTLSGIECCGWRLGWDEGLWELALSRAAIEVASARLYGVSVDDFDMMMRDFPQVDGAQPGLEGEAASSVTRDLVLACGDGWASSAEVSDARERVEMARSVGAVPFVANQHARAYKRVLQW